jgi:hypothetical protein
MAAAAQQVDGAKEAAALLVTRAGRLVWAIGLPKAAAEAGAILLADIRREAVRAERWPHGGPGGLDHRLHRRDRDCRHGGIGARSLSGWG